MQILINNINSSVVKGIKYSGRKLTVQLMDRLYTYDKVPKSVALEFLQAESKGKFYNENIKDQFEIVEGAA